MKGRLSALVVICIMTNLVLNLMAATGCRANTAPVGLQEPVGSQEDVGPQAAIAPRASFESQETTDVLGTGGLQEPVEGPERVGPADPFVLAARVLKLVGLAAAEG